MDITKIQGLKYPDEYFIKFFFKFQLHQQKKKTFLELGCSNGCNLMLPYQFKNNIIGVDLDRTLIDYANQNFKLLQSEVKFQFYNENMIDFCNKNLSLKIDALILANSIYYIEKENFITLLQNINKNNFLNENIPFFIRFRATDDFRNNKGQIIQENSIIMQNGITGEDGIFCKFYELDEMLDILIKNLNLKDFETMSIKYENIQNSTKVYNSDIVIWGIIN